MCRRSDYFEERGGKGKITTCAAQNCLTGKRRFVRQLRAAQMEIYVDYL